MSSNGVAPLLIGRHTINMARVWHFGCNESATFDYEFGRGHERFGSLGKVDVIAPTCEAGGFYLTEVDLGDTGKDLLEVAPGASVTLDIGFSLARSTSGVHTLVIGLDDDPLACFYEALPPICPAWASDNRRLTFSAPTTEANYRVRIATVAGDASHDCAAAQSAFSASESAAIGLLRVKAP